MTKKDFLLAKNTGLRASLLVDRVPGVSLFGPMFNKDNATFYFTQGTLNGPYAEAIKPKYTWANRERGRLWWTTMAQTLRTKKAMRISCARRLRHAFVTSLKEHGYDRDGFSLSGKQHRGLVGTLEMHSFRPLLSAKFEDLKAETDRLVKWVEEQQSSFTQAHHDIPDAVAPQIHQGQLTMKKTVIERIGNTRPTIRIQSASKRNVKFPKAIAASPQESRFDGSPATRSRPSQQPTVRNRQDAGSRLAQSIAPRSLRITKASVKSDPNLGRHRPEVTGNMSKPKSALRSNRHRDSGNNVSQK